MEGFLQRSVTILKWKLLSFTPDMDRYRLRYWINSLSTFAELNQRRERRDDKCPRCFMTSESQSYCLVDCSANAASLQRFRINILRTMRSHLTIFPTQIRAQKVCTHLLYHNIPCQTVNGWSRTTYDNHDRSKILLQGERLLEIEQLTHIPAHVHYILSHTLTAQDTLFMNALYTPLPPYTADFHIINLVRTEFTLPFHHNPSPFHPFIRFLQLGLDYLDTAHSGILVHELDTLILLEEKLVGFNHRG